MSKPDWSKAPEDAEFYNEMENRFYRRFRGDIQYFEPATSQWDASRYTHLSPEEFTARPIEWPEKNTRIDNIGRNRTEDDMGHYDEQREVAEKMAAREVHLKQSAEQNRAPDSLGKYDRRIKGKYNTGACTVDVYRVLSAFEITEPELQHCIKKLLAAGQRGAKDYQQDLKEAAVSLCILIDRLQE